MRGSKPQLNLGAKGAAPDSKDERPTVFVVDDDDAMRKSLEFLLGSVNLSVESYDNAQDFLERHDPEKHGCLLVDVRMPGMSGLALQENLRQRGSDLPVIIMTGYADVPMAVRAMQQGAIDFLEKPFRDQELLDRIQRALDRGETRRVESEYRREIEERIEELSPREKEVLDLIVDGLLNKQIAARLDLSIKTVELHRSRVMEKMQAGNLADLVRMVTEARVG